MIKGGLGVSGVLALVLMTALIVAFLMGFAYVSEQSRRIQLLMEERQRLVAESSEIIRGLHSTWSYDELSGALEVSVRNNYREPVTVTGLVAVGARGEYHATKMSVTVAPGEEKGLPAVTLSFAPTGVYLAVAGRGPVSASLSSHPEVKEAGAGAPAWELNLIEDFYSGYIKTQFSYVNVTSRTEIAGNITSALINDNPINASEICKIEERDGEQYRYPNTPEVKTVNLTVVGTAGPRDSLAEYYLDAYLIANFSGKINIAVYMHNYNSNVFEAIYSSSDNSTVNLLMKIPNYYIADDGEYRILVNVDVDGRLRDVTIDVLNVKMRNATAIYSGYALAVGGSDGVRVYDSRYAAVLSIAFPYNYTAGASSTYTLAFNRVFYSYINGSAIQVLSLSLEEAGARWEHLGSCTGITAGEGIISEPMMIAAREFLLLGSGGKFCLIDLTAPAAVAAQSLPEGLAIGSPGGYLASASDMSKVYVLGYESATGTPVLLVYNGTGWGKTATLPSDRVIGMTVDGEYVWIMNEMGPLYRVDKETGDVLVYEATYYFIPAGRGDKLERVNGLILFVRGESSREVWALEIT